MTAEFDFAGFGHRLRVAWITLGLTEEQAAKAAGRSVRTWRKYEATGEGNCTGAILNFVAEYPSLSIDWLFCGRAMKGRRDGVIVFLPLRSFP
jgi:hypothetical protein